MSDLKRQNKQEGVLQSKKAFLFIYPIPEYINQEIKEKAISFKNPYLNHLALRYESVAEEVKKNMQKEYIVECEKEFKQFYKEKLNLCINLRYRQKGFSIVYALFDRHQISDVIELQPGDTILRVGRDFVSFNTELPDGSNYPNLDFLLDQLNEFQMLRLAGFHMWDCVNKFAKRAYERGFDTLVDEDLTEFFTSHILKKDFRLDIYPSIIYMDYFKKYFDIEMYLEKRRGKPWLWQNYDELLELPYFEPY